jgi:hypothetical protein
LVNTDCSDQHSLFPTTSNHFQQIIREKLKCKSFGKYVAQALVLGLPCITLQYKLCLTPNIICRAKVTYARFNTIGLCIEQDTTVTPPPDDQLASESTYYFTTAEDLSGSVDSIHTVGVVSTKVSLGGRLL